MLIRSRRLRNIQSYVIGDDRIMIDGSSPPGDDTVCGGSIQVFTGLNERERLFNRTKFWKYSSDHCDLDEYMLWNYLLE